MHSIPACDILLMDNINITIGSSDITVVYYVSLMGRALDLRADRPGFESRLRPDKTYYLCYVDYNVHIR